MKQYECPIFPIDINVKSLFFLNLVIEELHNKGEFLKLNKDDEEEDFSIEMQLPFIAKTFGKFSFFFS